jgi:Thymidylate kinase
MAGAEWSAMTSATRAKAELIAVDGVDAAAIVAVARDALVSPWRGGISKWDASGVFQELAVADREAGAPSARTLLLLYAADLAFRLRWQIRPALAEGRTVVAAPYVATAVAFGRAAGLPGKWLASLFGFAPRPDAHLFVHASRRAGRRQGWIRRVRLRSRRRRRA